MSLEVTGRIIQLMDEVNGTSARGAWKKQEFVIETAEQYPKKICLSVWGEKVDTLKGFKVGDYVNAAINLESREYNGRWYTEARAWRIQAANTAPGAMEDHPQEFNQEVNMDGGSDYSSGASDDLPF